MNALDFTQKIYAQNVNMRELSVFNHDEIRKRFCTLAKRDKKNKNA